MCLLGDGQLEAINLGCCDLSCHDIAVLQVTCVSMLEVSLHGEDSIRTCHLEHQIDVVGDIHELGIAWAPQDGVVGAWEVDNLNGVGLYLEVCRRAKGDLQGDLLEWFGCLAGHDQMEGHAGVLDL